MTAYATIQRADANHELWLTITELILDGMKNNIIVQKRFVLEQKSNF